MRPAWLGAGVDGDASGDRGTEEGVEEAVKGVEPLVEDVEEPEGGVCLRILTNSSERLIWPQRRGGMRSGGREGVVV